MAPFPDSLCQHPLPFAPRIPSPFQCSLPTIANPSTQTAAAGMVFGGEPDVAASAFAAFNAIVKSNEQGSLIDHNLLIKILSNPKMIEKLVTDYGPAANTYDVLKPRSPPVASSDQPPVHIDQTVTCTSSSTTLLASLFYHQPNGVGAGPPNPQLPLPSPAVPVSSPPLVGAPPAKDISYYKSLIQQHGGERQEAPPQYGNRSSHQSGANHELVNNHRSIDLRPNIMKPCIYFNS
jgi:hypothetical protein